MTDELFPDCANDQFRLSRRRRIIIDMLQLYSRRGVTLAKLSGPGHMDRKLSTLKRYCCQNSIAFPDYTPRHMKPKHSKATSRAAARIRRARRRAERKLQK